MENRINNEINNYLSQLLIAAVINFLSLSFAVLGQFTVLFSFLISIYFYYYGRQLRNKKIYKKDAIKKGWILLGLNTSLLIIAPLAQIWVIVSTILGIWQFYALRQIANKVNLINDVS